MLSDESRRWFIEKVAQNPDFLARVFLPQWDIVEKKAETILRDAIRNKPIEEIKYQMGFLDGAQKMCAVIDGLRLSEKKTPVGSGLMTRMFSFGNKSDPDIPADLG